MPYRHRSLHRAAAPIVVALNGMAAGGGFSLVLSANLAVAKRSAKLNSAYTRTGLTPDGGGTWLLERLVGPQRAFDLMATNPTLTADQAHALGLVSRVVDDAAFDNEVRSVAQSLVALPAGAATRLKRLFASSIGGGVSLEARMQAESEALATSVAQPETLARLDAFLKK